MNTDIIPDCVNELIIHREEYSNKISKNLEKKWELYDNYMSIIYKLSKTNNIQDFDCFIVNTIKNNINSPPDQIRTMLINKLHQLKKKHSIIQYRKVYRKNIGLGY